MPRSEAAIAEKLLSSFYAKSVFIELIVLVHEITKIF